MYLDSCTCRCGSTMISKGVYGGGGGGGWGGGGGGGGSSI